MSQYPSITADITLDCKGLACPMPIVRTKKAMEQLQPGQVIKVEATDKGSLADLKGWANNTGHHYLGTIMDGDLLHHYLRKASPGEVQEDNKYSNTISNEELQAKLAANEKLTLLDVREPAEYAFNRIPGAVSIPLGQLDSRLNELNREEEIHVICRSGSRSDLACRLLMDNGFAKARNVLPGMSGWKGATEADE